VAQWVALRATSPADIEIRRLELIKAIEKAIHELETLAEYGKTKERLNLLGGSWKRLGFVQTERASRSQALSKMAGYYKAALDFANRSDAYAWTNWATAELLSTRFDQVDEATWSKNSSEIEAEAPLLREALRREIETNPNFWHYAGLADIDLVLLIAAYPIVRQTSSTAAIELKKEVIKGYQRAIVRGGSPREKDSLIENLDFMLEIIGNSKDPLMEAIKGIRDALLRPDF
jgi:hypothetical protein